MLHHPALHTNRHFASSPPKRRNVSLWDFRKPTVQCSTALHSAPPLCHNNRNNAKQASTQAHIPLLERPYIEEGASHSEEPQQTQHILTRRRRVRLFVPPTMSTANITTHVLPGGDSKEPQGQAAKDQRPILTWTQQTNALPSRPSHERTLASCTLQQKMCNIFSLRLPQTGWLLHTTAPLIPRPQ